MVPDGSTSDDDGMDTNKGATMNTSSNGIDGRLIFRAGIALVMVSILLLFRYSIDWFGPVARLGLGAFASASLVVAGLLVPRRGYGRLMQGAGVAGGYVTAWAAHGRYDLVDPTTGFVQMVLVAAVGVGLAVRERSDVLNALGMVGAVAAPLLVGGEFTLPGAAVAYQSAVLLLAGFLYARFGWWATLAVTVAGSGVIFAFMSYDPSGPILAGVAVWWLVGWALPVLGRWVGITPASSEMMTVATIPVPVLAWGLVWIVDGRPSVLALVAAVAALIHGAVWVAEREEVQSIVHLLAGTGFTALSFLSLVDADVAVPLYLLVTAGVTVHASHLDDRSTLTVGTFMSALALPVWAVLLFDGGRSGLAAGAGDLASVVIVALAAFLVTGPVQKGAGATAYVMALMWIARHLGELDPGFVTAGFAVVGLVALVAGRMQNARMLIMVGLGTVALAVGKLILVDLASADPLLKIALSFGIGVALLGVGYWVGDTALLRPPDEPLESGQGETLGG